jgi:hypothetical protein
MARSTVLWLWARGAATVLACLSLPAQTGTNAPLPADTVLRGGKILVLDAKNTVCQALAIRGGRVAAAGSDEQIGKHIGPRTKVIRLEGKTVVPGLIESHVHALGVAREESYQPWVELSSVPEVQAWIRKRAAELPAGQWVRVPRTDITRLKERRHPTLAEMDAACATHPVIFTAALKSVCNSAGFRALGITGETTSFHGGKIVRDAQGAPALIVGADPYLRDLIAAPKLTRDQIMAALEKVLRAYNAVGITAIGERRSDIEGYRTFREMRQRGRLTARVTVSFLLQERTPEKVREFVASTGLKPHEGDDWVKAGPLKIFADGGIHWGNTFLREPYGEKRIRFYRLDDPEYRGDFFLSDDELKAIYRTANTLGWQVSVHVTGDAGVDRILDAIEAANADRPVRDRRFTLVHAYFPTPEAVACARQFGVCVDTQPYLYYKDSRAIADVYGESWAVRLIGLGDWTRGGIPTAINSDHMIGMDPDHAMNSYNPFLQMYIAVSRKNQNGEVIGAAQKISRLAALRAMTESAAYLNFDERNTGSLELGKLADLAVLDTDYLTCPEDRIRAIRVLTTMVDGRTVYEAGRR